MFKGTYTDRFYRAIRDALHAEVASWKCKTLTADDTRALRELWRSVESLEAVSQNEDATQLPKIKNGSRSTECHVTSHFVALQTTVAGVGELNE